VNPPPAVHLRNVTVRTGHTVLLDAVSIDIDARERVAIVGHNGAGKTTLLRVLSGLVPATSGEVEVLGRRIDRAIRPDDLRALRSGIGQVFQGLHLVGRLSALENVLIGALGRTRSLLACVRLFPAAERARAYAALESVGVAHRADMRVDRLSGGERQKVAIARALNQAPRILLADEPTASLDPPAAREIAELLSSIAASARIPLVTVGHTTTLLPLLADRVIGLSGGRVAFDHPIGAIDRATLDALYTGDPPLDMDRVMTPRAPAARAA